jgi:nicotinamidase-related amidase/type 1 glutamine amidotransferase
MGPRAWIAALTFVLLNFPAAEVAAQGEPLRLNLRRRVETSPGSKRHHAISERASWNARETAIVVCDMWDDHWCKGAAARVAEMAPRMNEVLAAARKRGVLVIHCPSECMAAYKETPQRKLAQQAPVAPARRPLERWCGLNQQREGPLPIDDSDGGCDCSPRCAHGAPWRRQIAALSIEPGDAITDNAEAYYLMRQRGIKNVLVMGVHANICVLGRPFSIRQLTYQGLNVAVVRDLTDTMYNSRARPYVNHFTGNDLVVEHIETYWCPTLLSSDFVGGREFRFKADRRKHVVIVMAEDEYDTQRTLPEFARANLGKEYRTTLVFGDEKDRNSIPGVEAVKGADVLVLSLRRRTLRKEQLAVFREHAAAGKPIVAIRTASHGFSPPKGAAPPPGHEVWDEFDRDVLGGNYTGHHGNSKPGDPRTLVRVVPDAARHPILRGVPGDEFVVRSWLYKVSPLAKGATPLLIGRVEGREAPEPVAWTHTRRGGRVFYTSLGHPEDFELPAVEKLLKNAIDWAAESNRAKGTD